MDMLNNYYPMFMESIDKNRIGLCRWIEAGDTLDTALPEIRQMTDNKEEWQAIIVRNYDEAAMREFACSDDNPFDFEINRQAEKEAKIRSEEVAKKRKEDAEKGLSVLDYEEQIPYAESEIPLVRLTHILGGIPAPQLRFMKIETTQEELDEAKNPNEVLYIEDIMEKLEKERADRELKKAEYMEAGKSEEEAEELLIEADEIDYASLHKRVIFKPVRSREEDALYEKLKQKYYFSGKTPTNIVLVNVRRNRRDIATEVKNAWLTPLETSSSEFWKRNNYSSMCRFVVYDYNYKGDNQRMADIFSLWMCVLLLALNDVDPSTFQAYRLYRMNCEYNRERMIDDLQHFANRLRGGRIALDKTLRESLTRDSKEDLELPDFLIPSVPVNFPISPDREYEIDGKEFGITSESRLIENHRWAQLKDEAEGKLDESMKLLDRALDRTAMKMREHCHMNESEVEDLNPFQLVDMDETLESLYDSIFTMQRKLPKSLMSVEEELEDTSEEVKEEIKHRVSFVTVLALIGGILLSVVLTAVAALFFETKREAEISFIGLLVPFGILAVGILVTAFIILLIRYVKFQKKIDQYNDVIDEAIQEIEGNKDIYSRFMGKVASYARGKSYLNILDGKKYATDNKYNIMKTHRDTIDRTLKNVKLWSDAFFLQIGFSGDYEKPDYFNIYVDPRHNEFYTIEQEGSYAVKCNDAGNKVYSPFSFVERFNLEREELYDDGSR